MPPNHDIRTQGWTGQGGEAEDTQQGTWQMPNVDSLAKEDFFLSGGFPVL